MIQAGKLRHRLIIEAPHVSQDTDGGQLITWEPQGKVVWGSVEPLRSTEQLLAAQVGARQTHRITLRYTSLPTDYRLAMEGTQRIFEPTGIRNIEERSVMLEVLAVENVREQ